MLFYSGKHSRLKDGLICYPSASSPFLGLVCRWIVAIAQGSRLWRVRAIWQFAQTNQMILITANRNMKGGDSLEQTMREENTATSLPILTIGNPDRFDESGYRQKCATRLIEILLDLENYRGVGRIFIPSKI
jgi:hypothetical protein